MTTMERSGKALADAYEEKLGDKLAKANLICETKDEADALAHELRERGWRTEVSFCLVFKDPESTELTGGHAVVVNGRLK